MLFIGLLIGEELGAFLTTFKVGLIFLLFSAVLLLTHYDLNIIYFTVTIYKRCNHFPPVAILRNSKADSSLTYSSTMKL